MTRPVRYQDGHLFVDRGAWFVRYRERVRQDDGSIKLKQRATKLGSVRDYPRESDIRPLLVGFMQRLNAGKFAPEPSITLKEFCEKIYLPYLGKARLHEEGLRGNLEESHLRSRRTHSFA